MAESTIYVIKKPFPFSFTKQSTATKYPGHWDSPTLTCWTESWRSRLLTPFCMVCMDLYGFVWQALLIYYVPWCWLEVCLQRIFYQNVLITFVWDSYIELSSWVLRNAELELVQKLEAADWRFYNNYAFCMNSRTTSSCINCITSEQNLLDCDIITRYSYKCLNCQRYNWLEVLTCVSFLIHS